MQRAPLRSPTLVLARDWMHCPSREWRALAWAVSVKHQACDRAGPVATRQASRSRSQPPLRARSRIVSAMEDPWRVKYNGTCTRCGTALLKGMPAVWDRATRTIRCIECPIPQPPPPPPAPAAVDKGVAGHSARVEYERRAAKREAAIAERWGTGLVSKVVRAVAVEPQSTRAWAIGAAGEEKLAAELDKVVGLRMLHDRRVPGTRGNIDHIVIAPAGVFVVDAKNNQGRIEIRDRGSFFRTDYRLTVAGRDCSAMADKMGWQVDAITTALAARAVDPLPHVSPVLCFLSVEWPLLGAPDSFRGVRIESPRSLKRLLTKSARLTEPEVDHLLVVLSEAIPPK
jgi:hypothetical protein